MRETGYVMLFDIYIVARVCGSLFALHNAHARALKGMKRFQVGYTVSVVGFGFVCWFRWIVIFHSRRIDERDT